MTIPIADVPTEPGVYRFIDLDGETAYVGQSQSSLRSRIRQHLIRQDSSIASYGRLDPWDISQVDWWVTDTGEADSAEEQLLGAENPYLNFGEASLSPNSYINVEEPHGTLRLLSDDEQEFRSQAYTRSKRKLEHLGIMLDKIKFADHSDRTRSTLYEHKRILEENIEQFLGVSGDDKEEST